MKSLSKFWEKRQNAVTSVMNIQKQRRMLYNGCELHFKVFASLTKF